ncbi:MAG: hypothetical protein ACJA08_002930 [Cyclobacteriaceae bacterium]|jgi:hypothetical protein
MKKFFLLITLLGLMLSAMAQVNLQNDLIGYFPFSGNISDTTGTFTNPQGTSITYVTDRNGAGSQALNSLFLNQNTPL